MSDSRIEAPRDYVGKKMVCLICDEEYDSSEKTCPFDQSTLVELQEPWKDGMVVGEKYEILTAITDGGMGRIYKARHTLLNKIVAIKTILPTLITSKAAMKRLMQEASALSILDHPNILRVTDVGIEGGQPYVVMDYIEGTNLDHIVKTGQPLLASRAVPMFIAASSGLAHAHQRGVIHRDIKPANIMICNHDGNPDFVKIIDFGIAKLDAEEMAEASKLTATGEIFGSPQYMSPEQCGAKPQDVRSDIYSLGCVMYFALTGRAPFTGGSPIECMYQQVHGQVAPFAEANPEVSFPRGLEEIVFKCLAKDPNHRYQTMDEVKQALDAVRGGGARVTVTLPMPGHVAEVASEQIKQVSEKLGHVTEKIHVPPALLAVAVVGLVIMVLLGVQSVHNPGKNPDVITFIPPEQRNPQKTPAPTTVQQEPPLPAQVAAPDEPSVPPAVSAPTGASWTPPKAATGRPHVVPPPTRQYSLGDYWVGYMAAGQKALKEGDLYQARSWFKQAHTIAGRFGNNDPRYAESLEALGRVSYKLGDYQSAKSMMEWVTFEKKRRYGDNSAPAKEAEKVLDEIDRALAR
jgi:serine/threonine-protein kinase